MNSLPTPDLDTAMVLGMVSTAIPFARSREAQAERWLRILRLNGEAGVALQALGVSEGALEVAEDSQFEPGQPVESADVVASVGEAAARAAQRRGAETVGTCDVLVAAMEFYGSDFDRVLRAHGTDRDKVLGRIEPKAA